MAHYLFKLDETYFTIDSGTLKLFNVLDHNTEAYIINPSVLNSNGFNKSSVLTDTQFTFLFQNLSPPDLIVTSASDFQLSNWTSLGWGSTASDVLTNYKSFINANIISSAYADEINPGQYDMSTALVNGSVGGTQYFVPILLFSRQGGAEPPTPLPVTDGLFSWFRGGSLVLADGESVTEWLDDSGSAGSVNFISEGSSNPTYVASSINGLPAVRNAGNAILRMGRKMPDQNTVFIVTKASGNIFGYIIQNKSSYSSVNTLFSIYRKVNFNSQRGEIMFLYSQGNGNQYEKSVGGDNLGNVPMLLTVSTVSGLSFPNSTFTLYFNGNQNNIAYGGTNDIMAFGTSINALATNVYLFNEGYTGDIAEFIVYNRTLTSLERSSVDQHLKTKYGIS